MAKKHNFDTGELDRWLGIPLGGGNLLDPLHVNDIRRFVQAMQNPNPLYYDADYAAESCFGRIVAPQSFVVATSDSGSGLMPAIQGRLEGTHGLLTGDEWWFYGPLLEPGDKIRQERMLYDYRIVDTRFAGPTVLARGDTIYINQRGEVVAKQRASAMRYHAEEAVKRKLYTQHSEPEWSAEQLEEIERQHFEWINSFREMGHGRRSSAQAGDRLVTRPVGPHSLMSFVTELRALPAMVWGAFGEDRFRHSSTEGRDGGGGAGWLAELDRSPGQARIDPRYADALYRGPNLAHVVPQLGRLVGMPRSYGYGVGVGCWMMDYVSNWIGEWGEIVHSKINYRYPVFVGDMAYINGEVTAVHHPDDFGPIVILDVTATTQDGVTVADGVIQARLSRESEGEAFVSATPS
ncbi:MaoC family dehydratase N-terminal domain-containing protein [Pseudohaliea sp.]|uniref:FAS1-like dehydratase domain-containing protein n=1 Tax=Pseudohaliea sp. TaxID=2740289 RepID=UPI0032ED2B2F